MKCDSGRLQEAMASASQLMLKLGDGRESCLNDAVLQVKSQIGISRVDEQVKCLMQGKDQIVSVWIHSVLKRRHVSVGLDQKVALNLLPRQVADSLVEEQDIGQENDGDLSRRKDGVVLVAVVDSAEVWREWGASRKTVNAPANPGMLVRNDG